MTDFSAEATVILQKIIIGFQDLQMSVIDQVKFNIQQVISLNNELEKIRAEKQLLINEINELKNQKEIKIKKEAFKEKFQ